MAVDERAAAGHRRPLPALPRLLRPPGLDQGRRRKPVNALLGATNLILQEVAAHEPRAVVLCLGPDAADYRVDLYAGYHAERPEVPEDLARQWADAPAFFEAFGWTSAVTTIARGRRPARHLRGPRGRSGRASPAPDRRPRHVPVRDRGGHRALRQHRGEGRPEVTPAEVERATASRRSCPRLHRAARRPVRRAARARRASARRPPPSCCASTARSRACSTRRSPRRGRSCGSRSSTAADELRAFKRHRDAAGRRGEAPAGSRHRSRRAAQGGPRAGDERGWPSGSTGWRLERRRSGRQATRPRPGRPPGRSGSAASSRARA